MLINNNQKNSEHETGSAGKMPFPRTNFGLLQLAIRTHPTHSFDGFLPSRAELFGIGASLPISEGLKMTARMCAKTNIMVQMGSLAAV